MKTISPGSIEDVCLQIEKKTKEYKPNEGADPETEFETLEKMSWWAMVTREMSTSDGIIFALGCTTAATVGASLPGFSLVFGEMIDDVASTGANNGDEDSFSQLQKTSFWMLYIGIAMFFFGWGQVSLMTRFGEKITYKTQVNYFAKCLD